MKRVFVGVPLHAPPCDAFRRGYFDLTKAITQGGGMLNGWRLRWMEQGGGGLPMARNTCASLAHKEKYDVLFFLAGDIGCTNDNLSLEISRVLGHFERPEVNVVGGCYLHKRLPLRLVMNQDENRKPDEHGLIEVANTGMDFLAIRVSVLQAIIDRWPSISWRLYGAVIPLCYESFISNEGKSQGLNWNFFGMGPVLEGKVTKYLPEDLYFCRLVREAGLKIQIDTKVRLQHWGQYNYDAATVTGLEEAIAALNPPLPYA